MADLGASQALAVSHLLDALALVRDAKERLGVLSGAITCEVVVRILASQTPDDVDALADGQTDLIEHPISVERTTGFDRLVRLVLTAEATFVASD